MLTSNPSEPFFDFVSYEIYHLLVCSYDGVNLIFLTILCRTVFYGQYKCSGPGADESKRVSWSQELTASQAAGFSTVSFIDGSSWLQS